MAHCAVSGSHLQLADGLKRQQHTVPRCPRQETLLVGDSPRGTPFTRIHGTYWCAGVAKFALISNSSPAHRRRACSGLAEVLRQLSRRWVRTVDSCKFTRGHVLCLMRPKGRHTQLAIHALPEALLIQLGVAGARLQHLIVSAAESCLL